MQHKKSVMNDLVRYALAGMVSATLVACGGGGGNAGSTDSGNSGGNGNSGGDTETPVAAATLKVEKVLGSTGEQVASLSASEVGTVHVKLTRASGSTEGARVDFSDSEGKLVFSPTSALTNANGEASVEVKASPDKATGVATIAATATLIGSSDAIATSHFLEIKQDASKDPQTLVAAINSVSANPADKSIVIAGSGGKGRSEIAQLTFRVVDAVGAPVRGATVEFTVSAAGLTEEQAPKLLSTEGVSNASGDVIASVSSGTAATPVVVQAKLKGRNIYSQSDTIVVTTGTTDPGSDQHRSGLDLSVSRRVVNLSLSGDKSDISIRVRDRNGNPVAAGTAVTTTVDYGRVGQFTDGSNRGGCLLDSESNCSVKYEVQNPRPPFDDIRAPADLSQCDFSYAQYGDFTEFHPVCRQWPGIITIVASVRLGDGTLISEKSLLRGTYPDWATPRYSDGTLRTESGNVGAACSAVLPLMFGDQYGASPATDSTITVKSMTEGLAASMESGGTVGNTWGYAIANIKISGTKEKLPDTPAVDSGQLLFTVTTGKDSVDTLFTIDQINGCKS